MHRDSASSKAALLLPFPALACLLFSAPLLAVYPIPPYSTYPCSPPTTNCQGGSIQNDLQEKITERSSRSTCDVNHTYGFCDHGFQGGTCPGSYQWCTSPKILSVSHTVLDPLSGLIQFDIEYDFPNNYCQLGSSPEIWPIPDPSHQTHLQIFLGLNELVNSKGIFEHGRWKPTVTVGCSAPAVSIIATNFCGSPTQASVGYPLGAGCQPLDRGSCPAGGGGSGTGGNGGSGGGMATIPSFSGGGWGGAGTSVGQSINFGSGDVMTTLPLFSVQQSPLSLVFNLTYHSSPLSYTSVTVPELLGKGWTHPFNQILKPIPGTSPQRLFHYTADGREFEYTQSGSVWVASRPGELRGTVTLVSGDYLLTDLDGTVTAFDQPTGRWKRTTDRWGNSIQGTPVGSNPTTITDSAGRQLTLTYSSGVLQSISIPESPNPRVWNFNYNTGNTLLYGIRDPLHSSTNWRSFGYDGGNRLVSMTDDASKTLEGHTYDAVTGRGLTSYSEGGQRGFVQVEYDQPTPGQRRVTHRIDASTNQLSVFTLTYRSGRWLPTEISGPCSTCGGAPGDNEVFTYTSDNHVETVTDGTGNVTRFGYNGDGNVTSMTEAYGTGLARPTTRGYTYSSWPNFWTTLTVPSTDGSHSKTTTRGWGTGETTLTITKSGYSAGSPVSYVTTQSFDAKHRLTSVNGPRTSAPDTTHTTTYGYWPDAVPPNPVPNQAGRLSSVTDAVSLQTTFADYDIYGTARTTTDPNGAQTLLSTDARGRVLTRTLRAIGGDPEPADYVTTYAFDTRDRLTSTTFPRGNSTALCYEDGSNRLTQTIRRDSSGNQQERLLYTLNDIGGRVEEDSQVCGTPAPDCTTWTTRRSEKFVYDTKNRLSQILHPVPLPADSTKIIYTYDANGLLWTVQDERHTSANTTYTYDALNRLWQVIQTLAGAPSNQIQTTYGYDVGDDLTSVTDPNGNATTYVFDDFHRMTSQTSPVSGFTSYTFDAYGNSFDTTDANGALTRRTYDNANRLLTATSTRTGFPTEIVTNTFDDLPSTYGKGRLKSSSVTRGGSAAISTAYTYDRRGLVRTEAHTLLGNGFTAWYGYDGNGNRVRTTYPSGRIVNYTFDFADRPLTAAASGGATYVSSATYEPFGPEKTLAFGNGTTRTATWNLRYQPSTLTLTGGSVGGAVNYAYSLDPAGSENITGISDNGNTAYNRSFGYDDLNRLTIATTGTGGSPPLWGTPGSFTYDALGNRTAMTLGSRSVTYTYDQVGGHQTSRLGAATEGGVITSAYHDAAGNETAFGPSSFYSPRNYVSSTSGVAFGYDGRGVRVTEQTAPGTALYTVTPCRIFDTRNPNGPYGGPALAAGETRAFTIWGQCGLPTSGVASIALNLTITQQTVAGSLTLFPSDVPLPNTSTISVAAGRTRANNAVMGLSVSTGGLSLYNSLTASTHAILDVSGYFAPPPATARYFLYTPEMNLLAETNVATAPATPTPLYEYIWFGNRPVAQEKVGDSSALRYTMTEHLGTPIVQTNSGGSIAWRAEYEPFGNVYAFRNGSSADWQPLRFPGQEERSTSPGRFYNVFRWYRPDVGQYTQPDPILFLSGFERYPDPDLYAYVHGNPVSWADPLGLWIPSGRAYTACDGRGGIEVINLNTNCDRPCTSIHEAMHVEDLIRRFGDQVCRNRTRGWLPTFPHWEDWYRQAECRAYAAGKQCRQALLLTCCDDIAKSGIRRDNEQLRARGCPFP